jgi:hypothetical protein
MRSLPPAQVRRAGYGPQTTRAGLVGASGPGLTRLEWVTGIEPALPTGAVDQASQLAWSSRV